MTRFRPSSSVPRKAAMPESSGSAPGNLPAVDQTAVVGGAPGTDGGEMWDGSAGCRSWEWTSSTAEASSTGPVEG